MGKAYLRGPQRFQIAALGIPLDRNLHVSFETEDRNEIRRRNSGRIAMF